MKLIDKEDLLEAIKTSGLDYDWSIASIRFEGLINSAPEVSGDVVDINIPEYHAQSMGCGLEDRDITDRYEAMQYGFDCAIDSVFEQIPIEPLYLAPPQPQSVKDALINAADMCEGMALYTGIDCAEAIRKLIEDK